MNAIVYAGLPGAFKAQVVKNIKVISMNDEANEISIKRHIEAPMDIVNLCAIHYGVTPNEMLGRHRKKELVKPRHLCMHVIRKFFPRFTLKEMGIMFSGRDHSSAIHAVDAVEGYIKTDKNYRKEYMEFVKTL